MKVVISEKQLAKLIGKHKEIDEDSIPSSDSTSSSTSSTDSTTDDNFPSSPDAADMEPYPSGATKWPGQGQAPKRSVANPAGERVKKREDYPEAEPVRGPDNQIR